MAFLIQPLAQYQIDCSLVFFFFFQRNLGTSNKNIYQLRSNKSLSLTPISPAVYMRTRYRPPGPSPAGTATGKDQTLDSAVVASPAGATACAAERYRLP